MIVGVALSLLVCTLTPGQPPQCVPEVYFKPNETLENCFVTAILVGKKFPTEDGKHLGGAFCKSETREDDKSAIPK